MKKYHTVWGLLEANYVTCKYMYLTDDLNYYSSTTYNKILKISFKYFGPFWTRI